MDNELALMQELTNTQGPPGFEARIQAVMKKHLSSVTDQIVKDNLGSIAGKIGENGPKILLAGHLDEVGFMVTHITKDGFLRFIPLGGWWGHVMLAQKVQVLTEKRDLTGVIGSKAPHILTLEERKNVLEIDKMFIDIGATSREEAESFGVQVGDPIATTCPFEVLPNSKMLLARNWDNRAGCYVALKTLEQLKQKNTPNTVYAGATVQEEVGLRGAETLANKVKPDIAFALDVGVAGDTPGMQEKEDHKSLGKGPLLGFLDRTIIAHRKLRDLVVKTAKENNIPYQVDIMTGGGTDAGKFHLSNIGVPTMVVSVPARYIHSNVSIVHRDDLDHAVKLLTAVIGKLDQDTYSQLI
ncbi:M42 family metallopeptidase [Fictibacillus aquaticus]|uniref:Peptidase M28 n=1 Tax=Fictibacillus aquaticus TaxID=2021314 RepID=A0A235FB78_9BACL|nr:M42 family metallopeptidase [Fictibacillus aquaticus]OYD58600.1 peptidase M28 [Fictibacillus aquaticus]